MSASFKARPAPSMVGRAERHRIDIAPAVVVVALEAIETVRVYGLRERPNDSVRVAAGERHIFVAPEASDETLQAMQAAITAELERRRVAEPQEPGPVEVKKPAPLPRFPARLQCPACFGENSRGCPECQGAGSIPG